MKERPLQKIEAGCGAASAALRCAGLRSAKAALESNCGGVSGAKGLQESIGKSAGEWHFTLEPVTKPPSARHPDTISGEFEGKVRCGVDDGAPRWLGAEFSCSAH